MRDAAHRPVVLLAFANDREEGGDYLRNLPAELRGIRERLEAAADAALCELVVRANVTAAELLDLFQDPRYRDRIAIFHYGGHAGGFGLLLESSEGRPTEAYAHGLAELLGTLPSLRLVFLNGCATEPQAEHLLAAGVAGVIVTAGSIEDDVATELAVRFYGGMAAGAAAGPAFTAAVAAVRMARGEAPQNVYRAGLAAGRWPWQFLARTGDDRAASWNLAVASGDPLFGLPELPARDLPDSPFLHLQWYREDHAEIFFGRGTEIRALYERITDPAGAPILLLHGQSGVGKSSLLAAGLIPRLSSVADVRHARRDRDRGLAGTLHDLLGTNSRDAAREAWRTAEAASGRPLVVILDQVEEVFTRPGAPGELERLVADLADVFLPPSARPRGRLVLAFRKEWLADIDERLRERGLPRTRFFVERLDRAGVIEVVAGPARVDRLRHQYRLSVESGLPEIIADDLLEDPNAVVAPTLAILLSKMWTQATLRDAESPRFDRELYQGMRRSGLLLGDFLDEQFATLRAEDAEAVDSGLALDLLAFHTTPHGTAEYRSDAELAAAYAHRRARSAALVEQCQSLHVLTRLAASAAAPQSSGTRLSHDTLAPLIRQRFEESDRAGQRARRILDGRAVQWQGGNSGPTLDSVDLATVEAGAAGTRAWTEAERRLVVASRARRSRTRWLRGGVIAAGVVAVALILNQTRTARMRAAEAESRALAAAALNEPETETAVLLAIEAVRTADTFEGRNALLGRMHAPLPRLRRTLAAPGAAEAVAMSPDGTIVAAGAGDVIQLWDAATGEPLREPLAGHSNSIISLAFSPDGRLLASAAFESQVRLWDTRTWQSVGEPLEHAGPVLDLTFSAHGDELLTGDFYGVVRFWDPRTAQTTRDSLRVDISAVSAIALAPDDRTLAVVARYLGRVWDIETRRPLTDSITVEGQVFSLALSPDASLLAVGGGGLDRGGFFRLIDVATGSALGELLGGQRGEIEALAFVDDRLLVTGSADGTIQLWDAESRRPIGEPLRALAGGLDFHSGVKDVFASADGATLLSASTDGMVRQWEIRPWAPMSDSLPTPGRVAIALDTEGGFTSRWDYITGDSIDPALLDPGWLAMLSLSPDRETFASISTSDVYLWRTASGRPIGAVRGHSGTVHAVAFSPSGDLLATAGADETIRFWNSATLEPVGDPLAGHEDDILSIAFHPGGEWLASAGEDYTVRFWTVPDGRFRGGFYGHRGTVRSIAFSPDGSLLATGGDDGVARMWTLLPPPDSAVEGSMDVELFGDPLVGHEYAVAAATFAPDGRLLATGSVDGSVRIWDVATQQPLGRALDANRGAINGLAFSHDGSILAAASDAGIRLWPMTTAGWITRACRLAGRNLPARVWARLIPGRRYSCTCAQYAPDPQSGLASCER